MSTFIHTEIDGLVNLANVCQMTVPGDQKSGYTDWQDRWALIMRGVDGVYEPGELIYMDEDFHPSGIEEYLVRM